MNTLSNRCSILSAAALCLLMSACGGGSSDAPASGGSGGSGSGGGGSGGTAVRSHNAGQDCTSCHRSGGSGASKGIFTIAGTIVRNDGSAQTNATVNIYPRGSRTLLAALTTDGLGNFFTTQTISALVPAAGQQFVVGIDAVVMTTSGSRSMTGVITNGSCNACHGAPGAGNPGRVTAQQAGAQPMVSAAASGGGGESLSPATAQSVADQPAAMVAAHASVANIGADTVHAAAPLAIAQIAAGAQHSCVVKTDGAVMCWGSDAKGQLGRTTSDNSTTPDVVTALGGTRIALGDHSIAAGDNHTCAIAATGGHVLCWGANDDGQLGNGTTAPISLSTTILSDAKALSATGASTCALVGSGDPASVYCWGTTYRYDPNLDRVVPNRVTTPQRLAVETSASLPDAAIRLLHPGAQVIDMGAAQTCALIDANSGATQTGSMVQCWGGNR